MTSALKPARIVPPGRILKKELEARGWDQKDLATIMGRPPQAINEIINGSKRITPETALELAEALGTSAELWTNLEASYRLALAQREAPKDDIARRSRLYSLAPIKELVKNSWLKLKDPSSADECERALKEFFGIATLDEAPKVAVSFRHNQDRGPESTALMAWLKRVESLARNQEVGEFSRERLKENLPRLLGLSATAEGVQQVPELLLSLGVHFVVVPHLSKTYVDGAVFYLEDGHPIVALSLRINRIDCFWFTLLHELAHIIAGHQGGYIDNIDELNQGDIDACEQEANELARSWLVGQRVFRRFAQATKPYFSRAKIEQFAREQGRHPGIVLGQLQHQGYVPYSNLRPLLVNVKPYLDTWIDTPGPSVAF